MTISSHLLEKSVNRCVVIPAWATIDDWLDITTCRPHSTPLIIFDDNHWIKIGSTALNWFLMDMLGLRADWLNGGWNSRDEIWLLIHPLRYRLLGHQPKRPYASDVRDYMKKIAPHILRETLAQHAYFAHIPTVKRHEHNDIEAERLAGSAPWNRVAVLDENDHVEGMVWAPGQSAGKLPPIWKPPYPAGSTTYLK